METIVCINLKKGLPSSVRIEKDGEMHEHRSTSAERDNCSIGWLIWTLTKNGQVMSDAYGTITQRKFKKKFSLFLVFSDNPRSGFNVRTIKDDFRKILLHASWRVQTQVDTENFVDIINLDCRKSPAIHEWIIGSDLEFHRVEDMVFSLAKEGKYREAVCLAEGVGLKRAPEIITEGLTSGNSDFPNMHTERRVEAK